MADVPPIKYTEASGLEIAYQVVGRGDPAFIGVPGFAQNIELLWEEPRANRFLRRFGSFCGLIHFDKRGTVCRPARPACRRSPSGWTTWWP